LAPKNNTLDFFDILIVLARHKKFLIQTVVGITVLALVVSLVWPKKYLSTSEVIQTRESLGSLGGLLQSFSSISSGQNKIGGETIIVILNSENLKEELIEEFNLEKVYNETIKEALFEELNDAITIEEVREGGFGFNPIVSVKIQVEDQDPERAQKMNEFILSKLEQRMELLNEESTSKNLQILERRFQTNLQQLKESEEDLNDFQNRYGILEVSSQLEGLIQNLAELKTSIVKEEVEIEILRNRLDENSNQIQSKRQEVQALESAYQELIKKSENIELASDVFYSLYDMPDLLLKYGRLMREVEVQNNIYELLLPQLEQQRLFLANKGSGLQIIDEADLPTYKNSPKRAYIVIAGFMFSIFLALLVIYLRELYYGEDSEYKGKIDSLRKELSFKKSE
jgi:uncharacterized protein involved in exopolysaccharide biosynthesis